MKDLPLYFIQSKSVRPQNDWKPITASVSVKRWNQIFLEFEMWVSSLSVTSTHTLPLYYTYITPQSCIWQKSQSPWQPNTASCTEGSCCMAHCNFNSTGAGQGTLTPKRKLHPTFIMAMIHHSHSQAALRIWKQTIESHGSKWNIFPQDQIKHFGALMHFFNLRLFYFPSSNQVLGIPCSISSQERQVIQMH